MSSGAVLRTPDEEQIHKVLGPHIPKRSDSMVTQPGGVGRFPATVENTPRRAPRAIAAGRGWGIWPTRGPFRRGEPPFPQVSP